MAIKAFEELLVLFFGHEKQVRVEPQRRTGRLGNWYGPAPSLPLRMWITNQSLRKPTMRCEYRIFERFPDGTAVWRATVLGRYEAQRKMQEFAEYSDNAFFSIDMQEGSSLPFRLHGRDSRPLAKLRAANG